MIRSSRPPNPSLGPLRRSTDRCGARYWRWCFYNVNSIFHWRGLHYIATPDVLVLVVLYKTSRNISYHSSIKQTSNTIDRRIYRAGSPMLYSSSLSAIKQLALCSSPRGQLCALIRKVEDHCNGLCSTIAAASRFSKPQASTHLWAGELRISMFAGIC